jgi:hypothetical protein
MLHPLVSDVHSLVLVTEEIEGFRGFDAFMRMLGMRMRTKEGRDGGSMSCRNIVCSGIVHLYCTVVYNCIPGI